MIEFLNNIYEMIRGLINLLFFNAYNILRGVTNSDLREEFALTHNTNLAWPVKKAGRTHEQKFASTLIEVNDFVIKNLISKFTSALSGFLNYFEKVIDSTTDAE